MKNKIDALFKAVGATFKRSSKTFSGSEEYWKKRYRSGRNSGGGSYDKLADFKAEVLNDFIAEKQVESVIEYGCGDGNQLKLAKYPSYIGFDISPEVISKCKKVFSNDGTKSFNLMGAYTNETAQLTLSLDVIYHLIEDEVYFAYMERLFESSEKYVIIYASNTDDQAASQAPHVKHRKFSAWVEQKPEWKLIQHIPNRYPHTADNSKGSFADFYLFEKM